MLDLWHDTILEDQIKARIVKKVGNRKEWEEWAEDVGQICQDQITHINKVLELPGNESIVQDFNHFSEELKATLNGHLSKDEIVEMLAQHVVTKPIMDALFSDYPFTELNPIAKAMTQMVEKLNAMGMVEANKALEYFYYSVRERSKTIQTHEQRQTVVLELFDRFFKVAFPKMQDKLGIVYTPVEIVDFINRSVDDVLKNEFGTSLADEGIHVLDPFTGTGTFMTRLMASGLIPVDKLAHKYAHELHANELVPLAYYVASMNMESTFHRILEDAGVKTEYKPNEIMVWTDTFEDHQKVQSSMFETELKENNQRLERQFKHPIRVIVGNPPYSIGQESQNDDNKNESYLELDRRIENTYVLSSKASLSKSMYDSYIRAYRWASDRIGDCGVIGFVTNAGWIESQSADGMRKCMAEEFNSIYVYHLKGNARTVGEQRRKEKGNVFGEGSRSPVAIVLLVKNPEDSTKGKIFFHAVDDYLSREEKLEQIAKNQTYCALPWKRITPDAHNDWLNQRDDSFGKFIRLDGKKTQETALFTLFSMGVATNRDAWVYNCDRSKLEKNVRTLIKTYMEDVQEHIKDPNYEVRRDSSLCKWTRGLLQLHRKHQTLSFEASALTKALYRPYFKQNFYFSKELNEMVLLMPKLFPTNATKNLVIGVTGLGNKGFSTLMSSSVVDLNCLEAGCQCFPRYIYEENTNGSLFDKPTARKDGISPEGLKHFQEAYPEADISVDDLFYYIYGILHSEDYRTRYANNLAKELPRIPRVKTFAQFKAFSEAGRQLAKLHVEYDSVPEYQGCEVEVRANNYRVVQMKWGKIKGKTGNAAKDFTTLYYNEDITISNIPVEAQEYVVNRKSALEWIVDRVRVKTDKDTGITNNFNDYADEQGDPRYPLSLVLRVITVSLETMKIVKALPALEIHPLDQ